MRRHQNLCSLCYLLAVKFGKWYGEIVWEVVKTLCGFSAFVELFEEYLYLL